MGNNINASLNGHQTMSAVLSLTGKFLLPCAHRVQFRCAVVGLLVRLHTLIMWLL